MNIGSLGGIVFSVDPNRIQTVNNFKQSGSASYGKHQRHCGDTLLEFVGRDVDTISFDMTLAAQLGVDVEAELAKIAGAERSGVALKLVIGKKVLGRYKWVITKHTVNFKQLDRSGTLVLAEVSVQLSEYLR